MKVTEMVYKTVHYVRDGKTRRGGGTCIPPKSRVNCKSRKSRKLPLRLPAEVDGGNGTKPKARNPAQRTQGLHKERFACFEVTTTLSRPVASVTTSDR